MDVLKGQSRERGGNMSSFDDMCFHKFQIGASELSFFQRRSRIPSARFTPNAKF